MTDDDTLTREGYVAYLYVFGVVTLTLAFILSKTYIQYHWALRMDNIKLFLGQVPADETAVILIYALEAVFSVLLVTTLAISRHFAKWKWLALGLILVTPLLIIMPMVITYILVWPGILIGEVFKLLGPSFAPVSILLKFLAIIGAHAGVVSLLLRGRKSTTASRAVHRLGRFLRSAFQGRRDI